MRTEEQTSRHLLLAVITTVFSGLLGLVTMFMAWEFWMVLLMTGGCFSVWLLHIARLGSNTLYENLCAGLMLTEFFFFGVHESSLFDVPAVACILILALFMLNKKWILYMLAFLYALTLLYHGLGTAVRPPYHFPGDGESGRVSPGPRRLCDPGGRGAGHILDQPAECAAEVV